MAIGDTLIDPLLKSFEAPPLGSSLNLFIQGLYIPILVLVVLYLTFPPDVHPFYIKRQAFKTGSQIKILGITGHDPSRTFPRLFRLRLQDTSSMVLQNNQVFFFSEQPVQLTTVCKPENSDFNLQFKFKNCIAPRKS